MTGKKTEIAPDELSELEAKLAGTFKPVAPPRTVISGIQHRIRIPEPRLIADRMRDWQRLFAIFTGVLSGSDAR